MSRRTSRTSASAFFMIKSSSGTFSLPRSWFSAVPRREDPAAGFLHRSDHPRAARLMLAGGVLEGADRDADEPVAGEARILTTDHLPEQVFGSGPVTGHAPRLPRAVPWVDGRPGSPQGFLQVLADTLGGLPRDLHAVPVAVLVFLVQGEHRGRGSGEPLPV